MAVAEQAAVHGHATPYAGHPDILLARTVKEALNFLRLRLLVLIVRLQAYVSA